MKTLRQISFESTTNILAKANVIDSVIMSGTNNISLQTWQEMQILEFNVTTPLNLNLVEAPQDLSRSL